MIDIWTLMHRTPTNEALFVSPDSFEQIAQVIWIKRLADFHGSTIKDGRRSLALSQEPTGHPEKFSS